MKKLLVLMFALALVVVLQPAQDAQATEDGSVVAICHYPGHDVDKLITGRGLGCLNNGGNPIVVGIKACQNGHGVAGCDGPRAQSSCEFCEAGGGSDSPASHEH